MELLELYYIHLWSNDERNGLTVAIYRLIDMRFIFKSVAELDRCDTKALNQQTDNNMIINILLIGEN